MYVRWKRQQRKPRVRYESEPGDRIARKVVEPECLLSAVLVESHRVNGQPRQRTVAYLGSIRESHLTSKDSIGRRDYFWRCVNARLDGLDLPPEDRARIVATLEATVPRPAEEEAERYYSAARSLLAALEAEVRGFL